MVEGSLTSTRSTSNSTRVPGRRFKAKSSDPLTLAASITAPLWNLTPSRKVISQVRGSIWVAPVASQGSGFKSSPNRNRVSDSPVGTANQPA